MRVSDSESFVVEQHWLKNRLKAISIYFYWHFKNNKHIISLLSMMTSFRYRFRTCPVILVLFRIFPTHQNLIPCPLPPSQKAVNFLPRLKCFCRIPALLDADGLFLGAETADEPVGPFYGWSLATGSLAWHSSQEMPGRNKGIGTIWRIFVMFRAPFKGSGFPTVNVGPVTLALALILFVLPLPLILSASCHSIRSIWNRIFDDNWNRNTKYFHQF